VYGVLGSLMAVVVWSYLASLALMWGAQVCFTYSRLYGGQQALGIPPELAGATASTSSREGAGLPGLRLTLGRWLWPARKKQP
jgi:uncharacterized BrkB/YihY/UPF0761 family membrane protein